MNAEERAFLNAFAASPDDEAPHRIFADWLEERGRDDDAAYHRRWTVEVRNAEDWIRRFAKEISYEDEDWYTYEQIIEAGYYGLKSGYLHWGTDAGADFFRDGKHNRNEFWRNWSLVTGVNVTEEQAENIGVSCAC